MVRRVLAAIALLSLVIVPASTVLAQDMGMGLFSIAEHPTLGPIVADSAGMTLYTWAGDEPGVSNCSGPCTAARSSARICVVNRSS